MLNKPGAEEIALIVRSDVFGRMIRDMNEETVQYILQSETYHRDGWTLMYWPSEYGWHRDDTVDSRVDEILDYISRRLADYPRNYQLTILRDDAATVQGKAVGNPLDVTVAPRGNHLALKYND